MSPCDTYPSTGLRVVAHGTDTLELSVFMELRDSVMCDLRKLRQKAEQLPLVSHHDLVFRRAGVRLNYLPSTSAPTFHLANEKFHIRIREKPGPLPTAHVDFASESLWAFGPGELVDEVLEFLDALANDRPRVIVSRIDVACDVQGPEDDLGLPESRDGHWKTRLTMSNDYRRRRRRWSTKFGSRDSCGMEISYYNKSADIKYKSKKEYIRDVWRDNDGESHAPTWRLECRYYRERLNELGIPDVRRGREVTAMAQLVWRHATSEVLLLCVEPVHNRRPTPPLDPRWEIFQDATPEGAVHALRLTMPGPSKDHVSNQLLGNLITLLALRSVDDDSSATVLVAGLLRKKETEHPGWFQKKLAERRSKLARERDQRLLLG